VESGEDDKAAAKREAEEETGLSNLQFIKKLGQYERYRISKDGQGEDTSVLLVITLFLCKTNEEKLAPQDPDNPEARWVESDQVADILTHPEDKEFYLSVLPQVQSLINS
jgi:8-oxo-dGTP pyrophosphatase MutT (NUDIX family)